MPAAACMAAWAWDMRYWFRESVVNFVISSGLASGLRALMWLEIWFTAGTMPDERGWGWVEGLVMRGEEDKPD